MIYLRYHKNTQLGVFKTGSNLTCAFAHQSVWDCAQQITEMALHLFGRH